MARAAQKQLGKTSRMRWGLGAQQTSSRLGQPRAAVRWGRAWGLQQPGTLQKAGLSTDAAVGRGPGRGQGFPPGSGGEDQLPSSRAGAWRLKPTDWFRGSHEVHLGNFQKYQRRGEGEL